LKHCQLRLRIESDQAAKDGRENRESPTLQKLGKKPLTLFFTVSAVGGISEF
jgi:hypothetical protein